MINLFDKLANSSSAANHDYTAILSQALLPFIRTVSSRDVLLFPHCQHDNEYNKMKNISKRCKKCSNKMMNVLTIQHGNKKLNIGVTLKIICVSIPAIFKLNGVYINC